MLLLIFFQLFFSRSSSLVLTYVYLVLFEVTFLFNFFSLSPRSVFFTKSVILGISVLSAKLACANLAAKFSDVNLLNSWEVIYLSWSVVILFSVSLIVVLQSVFVTKSFASVAILLTVLINYIMFSLRNNIIFY